MTIREMTEQNEEKILSPYAVLSKNTLGRQKKITPCDMRTEFQRDRDRIIHAKSFRRLKHKTQVFLAPAGDHYRTRLTHTMEVAQIARTIARCLRLNEDLTEAIALGHDLGHTPFGHSGERGLNKICPYGFRHNLQSLRVVDVLENDGNGMNLTFELRDGIVTHTDDIMPKTAEGKIIRIADRIAYINHDIDDSIRAGVLKYDDIPKEFKEYYGDTRANRISSMIHNVVKNSANSAEIKMDEEGYSMLMKLRDFMFNEVYLNPFVRAEEERAHNIISELYTYFLKNPEQMPKDYIKGDPNQDACDYIAGMTDTYCVHVYKELFIPKSFTVF